MRAKHVTAVIVIATLGVGLLLFVLWRIGSEQSALTESGQTENYAPLHKIVGLSVEGRQIESYTYGHGRTHLAFVGGIHGGYEWNSILLAYKFIDYLDANPGIIPANLTITVIPSANPDGVYKIVGKEERFIAADVPDDISSEPGRFNAHKVDLNRNFDCKWKPESTWRGNIVSGGSAPFSEPETRAIRDFVLKNNPVAVVFWHSQSNAVYASECEGGILKETLGIAEAYSRASGYPAVDSFDAYDITGDAEGWLASIGIPSITVELKTHETVEWERNLAGIKALFEYFK
ncbi:MAG: hypothetical protein A2653_02075 [Candidatus Zambryskibacteria bacterium RIFCSPHIGHO2_01_FULL_43_25]|uniref:Peptidase M14 domain-containing protein n=1 Tax=Candidatus Zambryskibacteria bacterium RIFCSPLOWO2_01_FULL_45_21 TaxID=1802761 RepID=A0A1G2U2V7_9BACT|nr:MAG: hypothetical protein A2653_02075 [Candidatus Zambryskibacteria bacterium RIFCSPHIGHO2_01_FULL_43_25]OHA99978.1 MAG: hypothetical protein A3E94_03120 [Candidatus Zambryskibacteria bacterium RIFCSPHIGHO2_12_FULL_44_12b]OHB03814.1 MAG: hypothetical protein A3B14_03935 [Candidatus Zambryskibacteria bacterium RIFCSPLOWO2_01_FULL_45_21]